MPFEIFSTIPYLQSQHLERKKDHVSIFLRTKHNCVEYTFITENRRKK